MVLTNNGNLCTVCSKSGSKGTSFTDLGIALVLSFKQISLNYISYSDGGLLP